MKLESSHFPARDHRYRGQTRTSAYRHTPVRTQSLVSPSSKHKVEQTATVVLHVTDPRGGGALSPVRSAVVHRVPERVGRLHSETRLGEKLRRDVILLYTDYCGKTDLTDVTFVRNETPGVYKEIE
ncbi:hypothetical protein WMY93_015856 [Mugilogobius chulae]|uniref:Uncharacterized protein n=1 Tax=Mugilogobius chulae TaxID=88201 RepID=A0AAW0P1E2_9GOBI